MNSVNPTQFLALRGSVPLLDVRSPAEFVHAHIPGSISFPLFDNEERAIVGTTYTQKSKTDAVLVGLRLVGPRLADMAGTALRLATEVNPDNRRVAVTCWRGGMRSSSLAWLLEQVGLQAVTLHGGYKAYRRHVQDVCAASRPILVLGGMTGAGKTEVLQELALLGSQTVDLEGLAKHRGSAFGSVQGVEQPSTEHFENVLADCLMALEPSRPIWLEDESQNLGKVNIPKPFFTRLRAASVIRLDVPRTDRTERIVRGYDPAHNDFAAEGIERIRKRLGDQNCRAALEALAAGDYTLVTNILLDYYDRAYTKQLVGRQSVARTLLAEPGESPASLAQKLHDWEAVLAC